MTHDPLPEDGEDGHNGQYTLNAQNPAPCPSSLSPIALFEGAAVASFDGRCQTARLRPRRSSVLPCSRPSRRGLPASERVAPEERAAGLDRRCARRRWFRAAGMKEAPPGPNQGRLRGQDGGVRVPVPIPTRCREVGNGTGNGAPISARETVAVAGLDDAAGGGEQADALVEGGGPDPASCAQVGERQRLHALRRAPP